MEKGTEIYIGCNESFLSVIHYEDKESLEKSIESLKKQYGGTIHYSSNFKKFTEELDKYAKMKFHKDWYEISEEKFWEMLEILPPQKFTNFEGGQIFRMCEYISGNFTEHFMQKGNKYYGGCFDTSTYKDIKDLVTNLK